MNKSLYLIALLAILPFVVDESFAVSFINIDLSGSQNANDTPFGIDCDKTHCYVTIDKQGSIARVTISDQTVSLIDDDEVKSSGQNFYGIVLSNDKLFITERDTGQLKICTDKTDCGNNANWKGIALPPDILASQGGGVSYTDGYAVAPNKITAGGNTQEFGFTNFAESVATNSKVWHPLCYEYDFTATMEGAGAVDVAKWCGVVEIDPTTDAVSSRTQIAGASNLRGTTIDVSDSTIIWITDGTTNKIYKFDTDTKTLTDTFDLPASTSARGIADDGKYLYVAQNTASAGDNSKILKINKSTEVVTVIDTGASNTSEGTFEVFVADGFLVWTDGSSHTGTISLSNNSVKTVSNTIDTDSNRFGKLVNGQVWFAGKGSAKIGVFSLPSSVSIDKSNGDSNEWRTKGTYGMSWENNRQFVTEGFGYGIYQKTITDNFHTDFEIFNIVTGIPIEFYAKGYFPHDLRIQEFWFGVPQVGNGHLAEVGIEVHLDNGFKEEKEITEIKIIQKTPVIRDVDAKHEMVNCSNSDTNKQCHKVTIKTIFDEPIKDKVALIKGIDGERRTTETYLNEGVNVFGIQLSDLPTKTIPNPEKYGGLTFVKQTSKYSDLWVSEDGKVFQINDFNTPIWINKDYSRNNDNGDPKNRLHSDFEKLIQWTRENASKVFDSELIQKHDKGFIPYELDSDGIDKRTLTLKKLGWN